MDEEIERLKCCARKGNEVVKTKEDTIILNNRNIEAKEEEIRKLRLELNHNKAKVDSLQRNMRELNWKVDRAQRDAHNAQEDKRRIQAELGGRRWGDRRSRDSNKRSMDRSNSPPMKRYSPSPSPAETRGTMSPPRSPLTPRSQTPRGRSPAMQRRGSWQKISPIRDIERPMSRLGRGQSTSPMRGVSTIEELEQTIVENPEQAQKPVPEYHPTPKKEEDKDYQKYRKEVEQAKATGAIKKYTIPKKSKGENSGANSEIDSSRDSSK